MAEAMNEAKLREWMAKMGPRLITLSAGICRDRHRAEEIVQEAFVKLWRQPPEAGEVAFSSWLRRVVTNLSINALQRDRRPSALPAYSDDPAMRSARSDSPGASADTREQLDLVRAAMDRIDESKRAILMLRVFDQLSYEDIASCLGVPVGTVMSRLNRARSALMQEMETIKQESREAPTTYEFRRYKEG